MNAFDFKKASKVTERPSKGHFLLQKSRQSDKNASKNTFTTKRLRKCGDVFNFELFLTLLTINRLQK